MKLFRMRGGFVLEYNGRFFEGPLLDLGEWDALLTRDDLQHYFHAAVPVLKEVDSAAAQNALAPIGNQEVWAAGVTYYRSRDARMEESKSAGGGDFYDRVYSAPRPELFFKATAHRVVGPAGNVSLRSDSNWSVPEPELTLVVTPTAKIIGYTVGNDMSSRDIEGENPLYLPQAKLYDRSCALGPCILLSDEPLPKDTEIRLDIWRNGRTEFSAATTLECLKREPKELVSFLFRNNSFPRGCFLLTGTGIVPPDSFTLLADDEIRITIPPIGTLVNHVG
jgi:2-dehydro-3-deoxy-D-arabinonate dehydratase